MSLKCDLYWAKASAMVIATFAGLTPPAYAQLNDLTRYSIAATIEDARPKLDAQRLPDPTAIALKVASAADDVRSYFQPITSAENTDRWMTFLATERLVEALRGGEPEPVWMERAERTRARMIGVAPGLELPALRRLRDQVNDLIAAARFEDREKGLKFVDQQLTSLDQRIREADAIPTTEQAAAIGAIARAIGNSNQADAVVPQLRSAFSHPNLVFHVSSGLVQRAANQPVNRDRPINDCILGTRIIGNGQLSGFVTVRTLQADGRAAVELTLNANFQSQNTGYNGPVTLSTSGNGNVVSQQTIFIAESGLSLTPPSTTANLTSQIHSINHPLRLVRKIASKKAAAQKPKADRIATEKLRQQVGSEFDQQVTAAVSSAPSANRRSAFDEGRVTLTRLDLPEPIRTLHSNESAIYLEATQADSDQLAAINRAPSLMPATYDVAIQIHESTVDNVATRVLAGRTMSGKQIDRLLADIGRPVTPPASTTSAGTSPASTSPTGGGDEAEENFVIEFAKFRPIIFEARDGQVKIGLRGNRFSQGERELRRPLEITASYRPVQMMDGTIYLERVGDVGVDFPGGRRLTISQVAVKRSIQRAFADRFPPTLLQQTLTLPATLPIESLRGQTMRATSIDSRDGWVSVSAK